MQTTDKSQLGLQSIIHAGSCRLSVMMMMMMMTRMRTRTTVLMAMRTIITIPVTTPRHLMAAPNVRSVLAVCEQRSPNFGRIYGNFRTLKVFSRLSIARFISKIFALNYSGIIVKLITHAI